MSIRITFGLIGKPEQPVFDPYVIIAAEAVNKLIGHILRQVKLDGSFDCIRLRFAELCLTLYDFICNGNNFDVILINQFGVPSFS